MTKQILSAIKVLLLAIVLSFGVSYVYAWTAPTMAPLGENVSAPINTSATSQYKIGALGVGGLIIGDSDIQSLTQIKSPQYCIGASCITSWPTGGVTPPAGSEFLNTSATAQTKAGDLTVNKITSTTSCIGTDCKTAWPTVGATPPAGSTFLDTSATAQTKAGGLTVNSAISIKDIKVNGITVGQGSGSLWNTAIGSNALLSNVTGRYNTAVGLSALTSNIGGWYNTAIGLQALIYNTASYNIALGTQSLFRNISGHSNTASGYQSLYSNSTGTNNVAVGMSAGVSNTTGSFNTIIGSQANVSSGALTNATAIGNSATVAASNYVRIGSTAVTQIGGQVGWSALSDARQKENVSEYSHGLDFITKLRPITYNLIDDKTNATHSGFLAQEVEATNIPFYGLNKPANSKDFYSLNYAEFVVPLVNSVKELKAENDKLKADSNDLRIRLERLEAKIK